MNQLKMDIQETISALSRGGWSQRRIARELGLDRETVARYRRLARQAEEPKPAIPPTGSEPTGRPNPAISPAGSKSGRVSHCEPFESVIQAGLDAGLSAQRIYQDLVSEQHFAGSYDSVKRFVRQLGAANPLPFRRMESEPGQEAQVDFGQGAWVVEEGRRRRPHVLRVVLSYSRKGYSEVFWRQTTENFIRGLENAFRHFGGVTRTLVIDNLRAAVTKIDWFEPELNPKVVCFCEHYGTVILPAKPGMPRHKGKVEAGVKYVQDNGLAGKQFAGLGAQNVHLAHWEETVADTRIHGTTRQQVRALFLTVEKSNLLPPPAASLPSSAKRRAKFTAMAMWKWTKLITRRRRNMCVEKSGRAGTSKSFVCSMSGWRSSPSMCGKDRASLKPIRLTSTIINAPSSNGAPNGFWTVAGCWARERALGRKSFTRTAALKACASCRGCWPWPRNIPLRSSTKPAGWL